MKALTISQPYASLIADGEKFVENRRWATLYRGPLAIHAGKGTQYLTRDELKKYSTGAIVAVVELVGCVTRDRISREARAGRVVVGGGCPYEWLMLDSHEHTEGPYCWILAAIKKLRTPIDLPGKQGLWDVPNYLVPTIERLAKSA